MPVNAFAQGEARRTRGLLLAVLALAAGVGCFFDTDLPTVPATPAPPSLSVLAPKPGDTVALTGEVSAIADSVDGVSTVTVLCGPLDGGARQAYAWPAPPYLALVDFSVCQGLTAANPDGGHPLLQLSVQALSDAGALSAVDFQVALDATGPSIAVTYPPTAQPRSPFSVVVTSDLPLASYPVVMLAGSAADSVRSVPSLDGGLPSYVASFESTPGLGTDNYAYVPGQPVPIEVLTDTEEVVRLTVDATALNGNTTAVDLSVDLSRVVWDRYIPGQPAAIGGSPISWVAEPVAFGSGLVLPLATTSGNVTATSVWIPGVLSNVDGTFSGFDAVSVLPGGLDGGYLASGLNGRGETLFLDFTGNSSALLLAPPPPATSPLVTATLVGPLVSPPLTAMSSADGGPALLCLQDIATVCSDATLEGITCFTPRLQSVSATSGVTFTGPPAPGVVAAAGGSYLSPNFSLCGNSWNLVDLTNGAVSFGPNNDPNGVLRSCFIQSLLRVLAVGDGTFVVQLNSACGATAPLPPEFPILRVGPGPQNGQSVILGAYTAPLGTPRRTQLEVVDVLADGRVVTLSNDPPNTNFQLWSMNPAVADVADVTSPIAGLYDSADQTLASVVARSVYSADDGSFAVLVSGAPLGVGVIAFGPSLRPLWLYLYPRVTSTGNARMVSASRFGDVYVVDQFNNRAVSLRVEPPAVSSVDAGVPDAGTPDAGPCTNCVTVEPPVVQVVPGSGTPFNIFASASSTVTGNVALTGSGSGGMLLAPTGVTISPNPPSPIALVEGSAMYPSSLNVSATAGVAAVGSQLTQTVTGTFPDGTSGAATFTIQVVNIAVIVSPNYVQLGELGTQQFNATVEGASPGVAWSVDEGGVGGTIDSSGLYSAPDSRGVDVVRAISFADGTVSGVAVVNVNH